MQRFGPKRGGMCDRTFSVPSRLVLDPDRVRGRDGEERARSPQNGHERPRVCFPKVLKIRGCHEDGRQLESLHFYRVP